MFGLRYAKASPSTYVIQYRNGQPVREGTGLAFFYFAPNASLVSVPLESVDVPFMFNEVSSDFQDVTVQGQVTSRVADPKLLASLMNFTLKPNGEPMDVMVNGTLIAQGEVVVVNDKFGIRLTDIITPSERMRKLNR